MQYLLAAAACLFLAAAAGLSFKIMDMHRCVEELLMQLEERMQTDTNIGIDITASDKKMRELAAGLDRQLKLFRRKQMQYTRGDQELKTAVTNISHDLRTPLTAIYGYLELLKQEALTDTAKQYLDIIENRTDALKALAEELFRYSIIISSDMYGQQEEICLNAALEESIAAYYGAFLKAGIEPKAAMPDVMVKRTLNRQALARIFSNIISNAVKYSDGDFAVSLDAGGMIHFSNHAAKLDKITAGYLFDRFYTVETGRSAAGLGLSIARTLTEEMGGKIEAGYEDGKLHIYVSFPEKI